MTTTQPAALPENELRALYQRHELATTSLVLSDFKRIVADVLAALQPQPAAAVSDAEIERVFQSCGGKWDGDMWVIEDADFHPTIRAILALRPQAESEQEKELRRSLAEAQATISQRNAEVIELHKRIQRSPQAVPMKAADVKALQEKLDQDGWPVNTVALAKIIKYTEAHHRIGITQRADGGEE